jgi:hypothetical protein
VDKASFGERPQADRKATDALYLVALLIWLGNYKSGVNAMTQCPV